jgi:hypothetical protein
VLLGVKKEELALLVQLFDQEQIQIVISKSATLVSQLNEQGVDTVNISENAVFIQGYLEYLRLKQE